MNMNLLRKIKAFIPTKQDLTSSIYFGQGSIILAQVRSINTLFVNKHTSLAAWKMQMLNVQD